MRRITVAAVFVLIAMAATVNAQQGTGDLRGKIVDSQQAVMPGVTVTVRNQENGTFRTTVSGVDGSFFISAMNPGLYQVEAMLDGFRPYRTNDVRLEVGRTVTVDVTLEFGGIDERLTVTAEAPLVDTTSKEVGGNIRPRSSSTRRRSTAASRASSAWSRASCRRSPRQRSAATRSASAARAPATWSTRWTGPTTTTA